MYAINLLIRFQSGVVDAVKSAIREFVMLPLSDVLILAHWLVLDLDGLENGWGGSGCSCDLPNLKVLCFAERKGSWVVGGLLEVSIRPNEVGRFCCPVGVLSGRYDKSDLAISIYFRTGCRILTLCTRLVASEMSLDQRKDLSSQPAGT